DPTYSSLNLSQAAQIVAFSVRQEVIRAGQRSPGGDGPAAPARRRYGEAHADHASVERLVAQLERMLVAIGYLDPAEPRRLLPRLRRLFARTMLEVAEVDLLRGICTRIEKVARRTEPSGVRTGPAPAKPDDMRSS